MEFKRMLSTKEGMEYTSLKRNKFTEWAREIGAGKRIGKRWVYDRLVIDKAFNNLPICRK